MHGVCLLLAPPKEATSGTGGEERHAFLLLFDVNKLSMMDLERNQRDLLINRYYCVKDDDDDSSQRHGPGK
jgi:hypothetical protein